MALPSFLSVMSAVLQIGHFLLVVLDCFIPSSTMNLD